MKKKCILSQNLFKCTWYGVKTLKIFWFVRSFHISWAGNEKIFAGNPRELHERPLANPKSTIWWVMSCTGTIGLYFYFENGRFCTISCRIILFTRGGNSLATTVSRFKPLWEHPKADVSELRHFVDHLFFVSFSSEKWQLSSFFSKKTFDALARRKI